MKTITLLFVCFTHTLLAQRNSTHTFQHGEDEHPVIAVGDSYIEVLGENEVDVVANTTLSQGLDVVLRQVKSRQDSRIKLNEHTVTVSYLDRVYTLQLPGEEITFTSITDLRKHLKKYIKSYLAGKVTINTTSSASTQ